MNRKVLVYIALAIGVLSIGAYGINYWWIGTPQYSLNQLRDAIQNHDVDTAFKYMDYDKMFEGFWEDIAANAIAKVKKSGDGFEAFGAVLGMNMLEGMKPGVKTTIRRAMEEAIRKEGPEEENSATSSKPTLTENIEKGAYKLTKRDDKVYVEFESGMRFILSKHPDHYWQITRIEGIDFPTDEISKTN